MKVIHYLQFTFELCENHSFVFSNQIKTLFNTFYYLHNYIQNFSYFQNIIIWTFYSSFLFHNEITWNQSYFLHIFRFHFYFKTINIHDVSKIFFKNRVFVKKIQFFYFRVFNKTFRRRQKFDFKIFIDFIVVAKDFFRTKKREKEKKERNHIFY